MDTLTFALMTVPHETLQMVGIVLLFRIQLYYLSRDLRKNQPLAETSSLTMASSGVPGVTARFGFPAWPLLRLLIAVSVGVLGIDVAIQWWHYRVHTLPWLFTQLFDVDLEDNIPTWFSTSLLLLISMLLAMIAGGRRREKSPDAGRWLGLSVVFLAVSLIKDASLHEAVEEGVHKLSGSNAFSWTIPAVIGVVALGLGYARFLGRLNAPARRGFLVGGLLFVVGALGMEWVARDYLLLTQAHTTETLAYNLIAAVKQALEMSGVLVLIGTLMTLMGGSVSVPASIPMELEVVP